MRKLCSFVGLAVTSLTPGSLAQDLLYESGANQPAGRPRLAAVPDRDGDGVEDIAHASLTTDVRVFSGASGVRIETLADTALGGDLRRLGDVDGDGVDDFGVAAQSEVRIYSGAGGPNPILQLAVAASSIADVGDIDADGRDDFVLGETQLSISAGCDKVTMNIQGAGMATVRSGVDGSVMNTLNGPASRLAFGGDFALGPDLDGDGQRELVVSNYFEPFVPGPSYVQFVSPMTGAVLRDEVFAIGRGVRLAVAGDLDGDGAVDLVYGLPGENRFEVRSGRTGALLFGGEGAGKRDALGSSVTAIADLDGDAVVEVLVASPQRAVCGLYKPVAVGAGYVRIYSGASGALLGTIIGDAAHQQLGDALAVHPDVDGDARPDIVVSARRPVNGERDFVRAYSGALGFSQSQTYCIAARNSAQQNARIGFDGEPSVAARGFAVTAEGLPPGTVAGLVYAPARQILRLDFDPYGGTPGNYLCVASPVRRVRGASLADGQGGVRHELDLLAPPFLPGTTWYFQYFYTDVAGLITSDALAVTITP